MEFLNRFMRDMHQRRVRSDVLSQTAQETGKRGFFPEFGMGEAARGLLGWDLDEADKNDPVFQENLQNRVDSIVPSTNPFQGTLGADEKGVEYKFPDTKQNRTGEYVDKTPSNTTESIEQTKVDVEKGQKAVGGRCVAMKSTERSKRKRSTKKGAIKRKGKASRIKKKRAKSMKKRARFGLK